MADCDPQTLVTDSRCLAAAMGERQLLAAILCQIATANGVECDAETLIASSKCLWEDMSERQLLAAIVYVQCNA